MNSLLMVLALAGGTPYVDPDFAAFLAGIEEECNGAEGRMTLYGPGAEVRTFFADEVVLEFPASSTIEGWAPGVWLGPRFVGHLHRVTPGTWDVGEEEWAVGCHWVVDYAEVDDYWPDGDVFLIWHHRPILADGFE